MPGPAARAAASDGPAPRRLLRRLAIALGWASFTAFVFGAALAVTMPAPVLRSLVSLPPQVEALSGSAWRGRAELSGGHALAWSVSGRDLWRARLAADATLDGPDTRLEGVVAWSPWGASALGWTGRAGPGLLALAPGLPLEGCTSRAVVAVDRLALGRRAAAADGEVTVSEGTCATRGGDALPIPAMALRLSTEGRDAVARLAAGDTPLAEARVTGDRRLLLRIEPEGAALVPGMPSSAPTILERPL